MSSIVENGISHSHTHNNAVRYLNQYRCPYCQTEWEDVWDCGCNDRCPDCNKEIEPHESGLIAGDSAETELPCDGLSLANAMPEVLGKPALEIQS